ncbi:type I-E CRISPR-associated protein Cas6/Cse3/CasE [Congregibacter variabilis]|uniref:Type I-E CRISPR-associated protein Cas6/Cse3/CasE n=1 Tax=Congregibacter variabilis TaxID=3081200 RepID=A0ABZ0I4J0_9GAMM|nr:type I-E CRISPR-associated protein Cas6/Cse3/CasE [Congregibacter sp. IMCC43200]
MPLEYVISKPATLGGYALHRLVMGLTNGESAIFVDATDKLIVRTAAAIDADSRPIVERQAGDVLAFELRASCSKKVKGKHRYFDLSDWRARHDWLRRKGSQLGFEVMTVHCVPDIATIDNGKGRRFSVDSTDFVGVLKVIDPDIFHKALVHGVGSTAKTFGHGFLLVT